MLSQFPVLFFLLNTGPSHSGSSHLHLVPPTHTWLLPPGVRPTAESVGLIPALPTFLFSSSWLAADHTKSNLCPEPPVTTLLITNDLRPLTGHQLRLTLGAVGYRTNTQAHSHTHTHTYTHTHTHTHTSTHSHNVLHLDQDHQNLELKITALKLPNHTFTFHNFCSSFYYILFCVAELYGA